MDNLAVFATPNSLHIDRATSIKKILVSRDRPLLALSVVSNGMNTSSLILFAVLFFPDSLNEFLTLAKETLATTGEGKNRTLISNRKAKERFETVGKSKPQQEQ